MRIHLGLKMLILVGLMLVGMVSRAQADDVTWTLVDVTSLGSTITGSFVYNADTATYSDIDITTTGGTVIPSETWTNWAGFEATEGPGIACCLGVVDTSAADQTGADLLNLIFLTGLTDAGGIVPIYETQEGSCAEASCVSYFPYASNPSGDNYAVTGYVESESSVPEPGTLMLLLTGMLGLVGGTGRRKFFTPKGCV